MIKNQRTVFTVLLLVALLFFAQAKPAHAQSYDLLINDGHVIDPKNGIDGRMDVAVKDGKVARVTRHISATEAERIVNASGMYVTPGLIDIHAHHYYGTQPSRGYSNSYGAIPPDVLSMRSGVTTAVDVGGSGWTNFPHFKEQVIDRSRTRILAFINIIGDGMSGLPEQNLNNMDPKMTALVANRYPEVVGVKIAHYRGHDWEPYRRAVEAGERAGIPVMVDFGSADPHLPLEELFFDILRPGDIFTHMYGGNAGGYSGRQSVINLNGTLRPRMFEAQERGIIFDVGHGGSSFFYKVAVPATRQQFWPTTISTDIHSSSIRGGRMKDMPDVMSKMLNLEMPLPKVIEASTWKPAQVIQREDLGHLSEGAVADIVVINLKKGSFGFIDGGRNLNTGDKRLEVELTIRAGSILWDLNGLASLPWDK